MINILIVLIAYFLGNISGSLIFGKILYGIDIRNMGSGNAGATNATRSVGKKFGAIVLLVDLLKAVIAVCIGILLNGKDGGLLAGLFTVIGHDFPIIYGFKGGKGIASSAGVILILDYRIFLILLGMFIVLLVLTKFVSIASISASVGISILTAIFHNDEPKFIFTMILLSIFAVYRHKSNISNLINGTESKFYFRKNKNQQGGL